MFHGEVGSTCAGGGGMLGQPAISEGDGVPEGTFVERKTKILLEEGR